MRPRTLAGVGVAAVLVAGLLVGAALHGGAGDAALALEEQWVSDTARENEVHHHPVGTEGEVVVAPVAAVVNTEELGSNSCVLARLGSGTGTVEWRTGVPATNCTSHALTEPLVADLDDDGAREVAAGSTENAVLVLEASTGREDYRIPMQTYGYGRPTAGNLTAAPGAELVAVDIGGAVVAAAGERVLWRDDLAETTWAAPVVADVDGDGGPEVVVGTAKRVVAFDATGEVVWRRGVTATRLAAADVDGDRAVELFTTDTGTVTALDGAGGETEWRVETDGTPAVRHVTDGDGDGGAELYVGVSGGRVLALDAATGERAWATELGSEQRATTPPPVPGDVTGDGTPELVAVANDGTVAVLDPADGSELATYRREVPIWTEATVADADGDGRTEIYVRYGDGRVAKLLVSED